MSVGDVHMTYVVGQLELDELYIQRRMPKSDSSRERQLAFHLTGPSRMWGVFGSTQRSYEGSFVHDVHNTEIALAEDLPFKINVRPWYFYHTAKEDVAPSHKTDITRLTYVYTIDIRTERSQSALSDDDFLAQASRAVEDLILLVGFVSRWSIRHFSYILCGCAQILERITPDRDPNSREPDQDETVVDLAQMRDFVSVSFTKLHELRTAENDPSFAIILYLSAQRAPFIETKFMMLFQSLEKLVDVYAERAKLEKNLSDNPFAKLRKQISDTIDAGMAQGPIRERIKTKLPELNRPAFGYKMDSLLGVYSVVKDDLYAPETPFTAAAQAGHAS